MDTKKKSIIKPMTMTLYSSREVDIFDMKIEDIDIEDIAHALANLCRYGGHCLFHYSVALHSVLCSQEDGTREEKLAFLLHDASEAYMNDLVRPIKHRPELEHYRKEEDKIQELIFKKFKLPYPFSQRVHDVDNHILRKEIPAIVIHYSEVEVYSAENEVSFREAKRLLRKEKLANCFIPEITPREAEELFLNRFYELYKS